MKIGVIFAIGLNGEFGNKDGSLPWGKPFKSDMELFVTKTKEYHNCVMGVETFKSLPSKLKDRKNIVLCDVRRSLSDIKAKDGTKPDLFVHYNQHLQLHNTTSRLMEMGINEFIVIGGKGIIERFIPISNEVYVTMVGNNYDCDIKLDYEQFNFNIEKVAGVKEKDSNLDDVKLYFVKARANKEGG